MRNSRWKGTRDKGRGKGEDGKEQIEKKMI
jgi:hypothetical protein